MKCADCRERPGITEDGSFTCSVIGMMVRDEDDICEYFEEAK